MHGFHNRILRVDLTERTFKVEAIPDDILAAYLGGKGLATHLLLENTPPGVAPLSPANVLIVATGPASGTVLAPASRYGLFSKSPLTGLYGESYAGGHVAPQIKATGYDAILLEGAADAPLYLEINDERIKFHDAAHFWGKDIYETEDRVKEEVGVPRAQAIVIGPAGENLVPFAVVGNNRWRQAGRCGMGAVMGSKKVKAIVFHGKVQCPLHDPQAVKAFNDELREKGKDDPGAIAYRKLGTPMIVAIANKFGSFPSRYWSEGAISHWERLSADYLVEKFGVKNRACHRCFFACGKLSTVPEGRHAGLRIEGPEYETIYSFGGLCLIDDLAEIIYLNDLCDRLGLDTITAGNVVAFAMEASRRGALDLELDYGDADGAADLLQKIAYREGLGDLFARGVRAASRELGLEEIAIHVKGLEPAGYDPRALKGMGLAFAVSDRGACHLRATVYKAEFSGMSDPSSIEGKAELLTDFEDRHTIFDTLIFCRFYRDMIGWDELSSVMAALTGLEMDKLELSTLARNVTTKAREFNLREGMMPADDVLPQRFYAEPLGREGKIIHKAELEQMVAEYYALKGWEGGVPK
ncbi:MAG: aldehyde ferredoxin oxidoreductase family protein [Anaerolineae bacterium]